MERTPEPARRPRPVAPAGLNIHVPGPEPVLAIPSHRRAGRVSTLKHVPGCILCVAESQAPGYAAAHPGVQIETHPDSLLGIMAKRQWMLDRWRDQALWMLDDDIIQAMRIYVPPGIGYPRKGTIAPGDVRELLAATAATAAKFGAYLFGWHSHCNPQTYQPLRPFSLGQYIPGGSMGFLPGHRLHFPVGVTCPGCDYWICALNAHIHRHSFVDRRFAFCFAKTYANPGGMSEFRGPDGEEEGRQWLVSMFGPDAIAAGRSTPHSKNKKNAGARALHIPWHT